jgi:phosphoribosylaminoimidazole-succinocarboxamide synthase
MFTPTTKAESGHDKPLSPSELVNLVGKETATELKDKSIALYQFARQYALERHIIIADTKFEFGHDGDEMILIDEALTPDSSRFWDAKEYKSGKPQPSFDKQIVRDWLTASGWDQKSPAPVLPRKIVDATSRRYRQVYRMLTGRKLKNVFS